MPPAKKTPAKKKSDTLPGGYTVGEKVFFTGESKTWDDGDKLVHGQQGEVVGPGTSSKRTAGEGVVVRFPGNTSLVGCFVTEVRRQRAAMPWLYALRLYTTVRLALDH